MNTPTLESAPKCDYRNKFNDLPEGETLASSGAIKVGMLATFALVTDTKVYIVTKVAGNSVTLAPILGGSIGKTSESYGSPFPVVTEYYDSTATPGTNTITRRLRKDGTIRVAEWASPISFGEYGYRRVDYRY